jgi:NDP-hexose 4-ketoreductase
MTLVTSAGDLRPGTRGPVRQTDAVGKVLLLGAGGFLGQAVRAELGARTIYTVGAGRTPGPGIDHLVDLTGSSQHDLDQLISAIDPVAVVNCTGATHGTVDDLTLGNVVAVHALLSSLAWSAPTARLVQIGSSAEYGAAPKDTSIAEDATPRPGGGYGHTKLAGSAMTLWAREQGFDVVVLRAFNVTGPGSPPSTLLGRTLNQIRTDGKVVLGPLGTWRDFVDVRDVARAVVDAAVTSEPLPPIINVGRGEATLSRDAVTWLIEASGTGAPLIEEASEHEGYAGSPAATVVWQRADITAAAEHLGWSPAITVRESLRDTWQRAISASRAASGQT